MVRSTDPLIKHLPARLASVLHNAGLTVVADLEHTTYEDLYRIPNVGRKSLLEIDAALGNKVGKYPKNKYLSWAQREAIHGFLDCAFDHITAEPGSLPVNANDMRKVMLWLRAQVPGFSYISADWMSKNRVP